MIAVDDLKRTHRITRAAGDYAAVAEHIHDVPPRDLIARAKLEPGLEVLDVATGTGNIALRAAARGCSVVGLDSTLELTERRNQAEDGSLLIRSEYPGAVGRKRPPTIRRPLTRNAAERNPSQ